MITTMSENHKIPELLVPAIDLCLLIIVTMTLCIVSARYSTKGSGEKSHAAIEGAEVNTEKFLGFPHEPFTAVLVTPIYIETFSMIDHKKGNERRYFSVEEFEESLDHRYAYVVYERKKNALFADVIRSLIKANVVTIHIAQTGE
jgi:hypothetical protein